MLIRFLVSLAAICLIAACDQQPTAKPVASQSNIPTEVINSPDFSGANAHVHARRLAAFGDRSPGSPGAVKQLEYLKRELAAHGWQCQEQSFDMPTPLGNKRFTNLRVRWGKQAQFDQRPAGLLTCHIDTKTGIPGFTGANDGASGAGLILELARILSRKPEQAQAIELVFFDGEESFGEHITPEDGLYGSRHYASTMVGREPQWVINLDMVGRQNMKIRIPCDTSADLYRCYSQAISQLHFSESIWGISTMTIVDDHMPFQQRGIPALNIIDDFSDGEWWHTTYDNVDLLSTDSFQQSGLMVLCLLDQLLGSQSPFPPLSR